MSPIITATLPSDGNNALAEDIDNPINAILAVVNGSLDDANIASMNGSKIVNGSIPPTAFNASSNSGWIPMTQAFTYGANNGQKEFTVTTPNDMTSIIPVGSKIKFTRGTTPPTQCASFTSGSSQYGQNSSPAGITFTGAYTVEAWIYLNSYTGNVNAIISRDGGTVSGFSFELDSSGRLATFYRNGVGTTIYTTYQSMPLKQWTHVAMSVNVTGGTCVAYVNGQPVLVTSSGSQTTMVQGGNLQIGARTSAANTYFNGYISEARIWSTNQTQSAIQSNMAINLIGSETNLVALWQFNGAWTDATSNANTLTANGGAINNQAANPYSAIEYGIVTSNTYSNPTGTLKIFTGNSNTIPNQTLTLPNYSLVRTPLGFVAHRGNWTIFMPMLASIGAISTNNTWGTGASGPAFQINIPTGAWKTTYLLDHYADVGSGTTIELWESFSTSSSTPIDNTWTNTSKLGAGTGNTYGNLVSSKSGDLLLSSVTAYYALLRANSASGTLSNHGLNSNGGVSYISAECTYL